MPETIEVPAGVDPAAPTPARLYDYCLGGHNNFEADRELAEQLRVRMPELEDASWCNRGFLQRAVRRLAAEHGVRQFLDIGAGLPTQNNTHQVAQRIVPEARVVYVDNDPMVIARADATLADQQNVSLITGDLRDARGVLGHPEVRRLIDFDQPVGLLLVAVVHYLPDEQDPWRAVQRFVDAIPPGSYLALSHVTSDRQAEHRVRGIQEIYAQATDQLHFRARTKVERFFNGMELLSPYRGAERAVTYVGLWDAEDPKAADSDGSRWWYAGVARKL
jgi:trans-aconitate methyltransferase